jgi:hypothetical protein
MAERLRSGFVQGVFLATLAFRRIAICNRGYYNAGMLTLSLKLPRPLLRELEAEAASQGVSKSEVVRVCLEEGLRRRRPRQARPSCLDLVDDLAGSFAGPTDLSTNPRYLDEALAADGRRGRKNSR